MKLEYFKDLKNEFKGYKPKTLASDVMAGITVAAVALPLALAFGVSSGADASAGLITAIIAGLIISALSGAFYQISGPTGAMAAILMSIVAKYSIEGVFIATMIAGIILLIAGIFKMGNLVAFIPMPVITGFTSGIAIIIALGQVDNFFGTTSSGETTIQKLISYGEYGFDINVTSMLIGLGVVLFMSLFPKKWNAIVPSSLVSIILATLIVFIFKLEVTSVGNIPQTLISENRLILGDIDVEMATKLISPAISIAMLGMIESLLCGASAGRMTGVNLKANQELIAQGIGNIILPFFGGIPATAAIARTSVAIKSGAKTRMTGIIHALALLVFMMVLAPIMSRIPMAALAGVLMVTAFKMNEWHMIKYILRGKFKSSIVMFFVTMITTIIFDLTIAILIGVAVALIHLVSKLSHLSVSYADIDMSRMGQTEGKIIYKDAKVAYISGPILFANTPKIEEIIDNTIGCEKLYLSMRGVSDIDITGAQSLIALVKHLQENNTMVVMSGLSEKARLMGDRSGLTELVGVENIYWSIDKALADM